jgi:hypothetical protein
MAKPATSRRSCPLLAALAALAAPAFQPPPHARAGDGNFGTVTETIAFPLPEGPPGATPELSLVYSSAAGNGNAGVGASVPWSAIRLDLRDGVPFHSLPESWPCAGSGSAPSAEEADAWAGRLWLDGTELVAIPQDPVWGGPGRCIFRTRPDSFAAVVPYWPGGGSPALGPEDLLGQPAGFAVIQPDGRIYWYGDDPNRAEPRYRRTTGAAPGAGVPDDLVVQWSLQHVQDRDGNLVSYHPERLALQLGDAVARVVALRPAHRRARDSGLRAVGGGPVGRHRRVRK